MGAKQQTVSRLESGDYEGFTLKTLLKIAEATQTHVGVKFAPVTGSRAEKLPVPWRPDPGLPHARGARRDPRRPTR
jgi:hypothetical protein